MTVNIIYCGIPHGEAVSEETLDFDTHNIYVNRDLPQSKMREQIEHELLHIINDDFHIDEHVNLVEQMVRMSNLNDGQLEGINFYHHHVDPSEEKEIFL